MPDTQQQLKTLIRSQIREIRRGISLQASLDAGKLLRDQVCQNTAYQQAKNVACFLSFDGEISTQPLVEQILIDKKCCYLPKIKPLKPNRLWFMPYRAKQVLVKNKLGIDEVDLNVNHAVRISQLDIIFSPLVAFDISGNRLGMGGGYYDATLAYLRNQPVKPLFYGLAYAQQQVEHVPAQPWDYPLDGIFTQKQFISFNKSKGLKGKEKQKEIFK